MNDSTYWATILDCIEYGVQGDKEKVRAYAELLLEKMQHSQHPRAHHLPMV